MKAFPNNSNQQTLTVLKQLMWFVLAVTAVSVSYWWVCTTGAVTTDSLIYLKIGDVFFTQDHASANAEFPPLYPIILELLITIGLPASDAAKLINVCLLSASGFILYQLLNLSQNINKWHSVIISLLVITSYAIVRLHTDMLSESLFVFLVFCNIYWLLRYAQQNTLKYLVLAAFFASLAALSRYAGVAVIISTVISAWLFTQNLSFIRSQKIILICAAASSLFALWLARNYWLISSFTGRQSSYLERESLGLLHYADIFTQLFFPTAIPLTIRLACISVLVVFTIFTLLFTTKYAKNTHYHLILQVSFISASLQLLLIFITWFVDSSLPITLRILAPAYSLILLMHFTALAYWVTKYHLIKVLAAVYIVIYILMNTSRTIILSQQERYNYNNPEWAQSETIQHLRDVEFKPTYIASNAHDILEYHLQRKIHRLPFIYSYRTKKPLNNFPQKMHKLQCHLAHSNGFIIFLNAKAERKHLPSLTELLTQHSMKITHEYSDGVVLKLSNPTSIKCP